MVFSVSFFPAVFLSFFRQTFLIIVFLKTHGRAMFTKKNQGAECYGNHRTKLIPMIDSLEGKKLRNRMTKKLCVLKGRKGS